MSITSIHLELFGEPVVYRGAQRITHFRTHNSVVLVALLALNRGKPLPREALAEALWPNGDPDRQRPRLRYELSMAREILGDALVRNGNHSIALSDAVTCDIWDFEQAYEAADRAGRSERGQHLLRAAQIPQADLLPGFYEEALVMARDRLRSSHYRIVSRLVEAYARQGKADVAATWRTVLTERYPECDLESLELRGVSDISDKIALERVNDFSLESHRPQSHLTRFFRALGRERNHSGVAECRSVAGANDYGPGGSREDPSGFRSLTRCRLRPPRRPPR